MLTFTRILGVVLALTLVAGTATAASSVTIMDLPEEAEALEAGESASIPFKVHFQADGFGCPQGGSVTIALDVQGTPPPPGIIVAVEPAEVTINVPMGLYASIADGAPVGPFQGSADATLVLTAENVTQNATVPITVVGTYAGGAPEGCQGDVAEASGEASTTGSFIAPPPPAPEPVEAQDEKKLLPAPGFFGVVVAAAAAVALTRRNA